MKKIVLSLSLLALLSACGGDDSTPPANTTSANEEKTQAKAEAPTNTETAATPTSTATTPSTTAPVEEKVLTDVDYSNDAALAKASVMALGGSLKGELLKAMKEGGPVAAISVCHEKAPAIAQQVSTEKGVSISRTSLNYRNPENAPIAWQKTVLDDFEARKAKGEDPQKMAYSAVVESNGKKEFRFMKAIPTGGVCLNCHGATVQPDVLTKIKALYPDDKATGYVVGDIRGAFVVTKPF
ncbi:MAG: Tll0287-like domain-containing protein [bacterium]